MANFDTLVITEEDLEDFTFNDDTPLVDGNMVFVSFPTGGLVESALCTFNSEEPTDCKYSSLVFHH